jgi:hypothetical protein
VDPIPDPLLLRKSGSTGNRTRTSESVARKCDHWTTLRGGHQKEYEREVTRQPLYIQLIKYLVIRDAFKTSEETATKNILLIIVIDDSQTAEFPKHLSDNGS